MNLKSSKKKKNLKLHLFFLIFLINQKTQKNVFRRFTKKKKIRIGFWDKPGLNTLSTNKKFSQ